MLRRASGNALGQSGATENVASPETLFAPIAEHGALGLAVSGGPDSLALMLLVARWQERVGRSVFVYCVDHGLRPEAAEECLMAARLAEQFGFYPRILKWDGAKPTSGVQAAARRARYGLIGEAMRADGVAILLTAHHRDDQAETLLMRMAHGSGIGGLGGMRRFARVEGIEIFRPLLEENRQALDALVRAAELVPARDPSNEDVHYERVRWRGLTGALADEGLTSERLARLAARMQRADDSLTRMAVRAFEHMVVADRFGALTIGRDDYSSLDGELQVRILRRAIVWAGAQSKPDALGPIEDLAMRLGETRDLAVCSLNGALIGADGTRILIEREPSRVPADEVVLPPGAQMIWDQRFAVVNEGAKDLRIGSARAVRRRDIEKMRGEGLSAGMRAVHGAVCVRDMDEGLLAVGCADHPGYFRIALNGLT